MPTIHDTEFGTVTIRRSARASQLRVRVGPDGKLRASIPMYAPLFLIRRMIAGSRDELRSLIQKSYHGMHFENGMRIGKSHSLMVIPATSFSVARKKQRIEVHLPPTLTLEDDRVASKITEVVTQALRIEAKSYLPKRLAYLANQRGFDYARVRFSHAGSRWGSCSSNGTISLNIALMKLPFELIDYVLIHELAHTRHMNHSPEFWALVSEGDPNYKQHRAALKAESPAI